tara:strand:+ start:13242 stop:15305 length:2064 start_codon:yes stop_codon:yes gene_type:complete
VNKIFLAFILVASTSKADLINPANGQEIDYVYVLFEWEQEVNAVGYNLQALNIEQETILDIEVQNTVFVDKSGLFDWGKEYFWRVRPKYLDDSLGGWIGTSMFRVNESVNIDLNIEIIDTSLIQEGFYLYSQWLPFTATVLIDKYGKEIWNYKNLFMNHVNEYGQLFGFNQAGIEFNYKNEDVWTTPDGYSLDSHEFKQLPNGNYMGLDRIVQTGVIHGGNWVSDFQNLGYIADGETEEYPWYAHRIVEFDQYTKEEVWSWNPFEHFSMNDHDIYGGTWLNALNGWLTAGSYDWLHTNAFDFDVEGNAIYVSFRHLSRISKIDYPSGQIIWNMGLPAEYNTGGQNICTELKFSWQHHVQVLENGDLLFFDNGNLSDMLLNDVYPTSRVRRIRVIDNSYCETVWQFDLPHNLYGSGVGSAQYLPNGNYYIYTFGNGLNEGESSVLEVTPQGEIIWKGTATNPSTVWYRSFLVPDIHPNAFSTTFNNYNTVIIDGDTLEGIVLNDISSSISFSIENYSGYNQLYAYSLSSTNDWFNGIIRDTLTIPSKQQFTISIEPLVNDHATTISLDIWPVNHKYALKSLTYDVFLNPNSLKTIKDDGIIDFTFPRVYPNPFNPITSISFWSSSDTNLSIHIYDLLGNNVATLLSRSVVHEGYHSIDWNAKDFPSGLYFISLQSDKSVRVQKGLLIK